MYSLIRSLPPRNLIFAQTPAFVISLTIAELFYKFGSFSLECVAFLITWGVLDLVASVLLQRLLRRAGKTGRRNDGSE